MEVYSQVRPAYITITSSAISHTMPRLWVMRRMAVLSSS